MTGSGISSSAEAVGEPRPPVPTPEDGGGPDEEPPEDAGGFDIVETKSKFNVFVVSSSPERETPP